tara:strand:- start:139 stop:333 length:195 start_codon:yes stop_codon:yes gene_type:complete
MGKTYKKGNSGRVKKKPKLKCNGNKKIYLTKWKAIRAAKNMFPLTFSTYRCNDCKGYHLTKKWS